MAEKLKSNRTTLAAIARSAEIVIKATTNHGADRERSELQLLCRYNSCKAVADNGRVEDSLPDYGEIKINILDSVDSRIWKGFGTETFILLYKLLASCHVLN